MFLTKLEKGSQNMMKIVRYTKKWKITVTKNGKGEVVEVDLEPL